MASTFSNLGLILQATGENSGTWGERTNVNLQRLDNAVGGIANIVVTGATTLAYTSNSDTTTYTEEAGRSATLVFSGSAGGTQTITLPNIEKQYLINNGSDSILTLTAGAGAATVNVAAGAKTLIYVDGSDEVVEGISATSPGGSDKQLQFNNNGSFGGITMGSAGQVLSTDGTTASFTDPAAGGAAWQAVITADPANAVAGNGYFCNTTGGAFTVTLPTAASIGDFISFIDYAGTFDTNNLTIGRNGHNIQGTAADLTVATERAGFTLVYVDATQGWLLQNN
jgi:predicted regulator of Ras-like GTPase activity (Roadblock/LC7/MglB family)